MGDNLEEKPRPVTEGDMKRFREGIFWGCLASIPLWTIVIVVVWLLGRWFGWWQ